MSMRELVILLNFFLGEGGNEDFPAFYIYSSFSFSNCYLFLDIPGSELYAHVERD